MLPIPPRPVVIQSKCKPDEWGKRGWTRLSEARLDIHNVFYKAPKNR